MAFEEAPIFEAGVLKAEGAEENSNWHTTVTRGRATTLERSGMQAVLPHFLERKEGHLINVSSVLARVPVASSRSAYSAAAAALATLTANLRMDLSVSHKDIHVSLVLPGHVGATGFFDAVLGSKLAAPGRLPVQTAEEIADIIEGVIELPRAEVYTSPVLRGLLRQYQANLESFETAMAPDPALPALPALAGLAERLKAKLPGT